MRFSFLMPKRDRGAAIESIQQTTRTASYEIVQADSLNLAAASAKGEFLVLLWDDCRFLTQAWDQFCYHSLCSDYRAEGGILYALTDDLGKKPYGEVRDWCRFPILSAGAVKALGYAVPCPGDVGLAALWEMMTRSGRVLDLTGRVKIDHCTSPHLPREDEWLEEEVSRLLLAIEGV